MLKSPKTNTLADELMERILSVLDEIELKAMQNHQEGDQKKKSETLSEVRLIEKVRICRVFYVPCKRKSFLLLNSKTMHISNI